jgi:glycosyltransferase involved in cell wall biosynthesis
LLESIERQSINELFEVIVVENDSSAMASPVVKAVLERNPKFTLKYAIEPQKGISFARNKAVSMAVGSFIAWIDDDEIADADWLSELSATQSRFEADAVFGPVIPMYPAASPKWARLSRVFERPRHLTGEPIDAREARTSNAFVKSEWFSARHPPFDPKIANNGGEDFDFFLHIEARGAQFIWSDDAIVSELVPLERQRLGWVLERRLRGSTNYWGYYAQSWTGFARACVGGFSFVILCLAGLIAMPFGLHRSVRLWGSAMAGLGRVLAISNFRWKGY